MIVSLVKLYSDTYRFNSRPVILELHNNSHVLWDFKRDSILSSMQNRIQAFRIESTYINLNLTKREDPILQAFSFHFTCIDPILRDNIQVILDQIMIRSYMVCKIGSIYKYLIFLELYNSILQALRINSICLDPILHCINYVILDPNQIQSYMA